MTETTADDLRTMEPDALRRRLLVRQGYRIYEGQGRYGRFICMTPPSHEYSPDTWRKFWNQTRAYGTEEAAWTSQDVPDYPQDLNDAWSLMLDHCSQGIHGDPEQTTHIEIFARPDGSVRVLDARYRVLSSLRQMKDYEVVSYPGLTGALALADALSRLAGLAIREKEVEE